MVMEPVCQATDWNQTGALNTYVGLGKGFLCGCDPLAWGQILVYHALNHGFPAANWLPTPYTGSVFLGSDLAGEARTTRSGLYDWKAIREQKTWQNEAGETISPAGRLMWDLGVMGGTHYDTAGQGGTAGTIWPRFARDYFCYQNVGYAYSKPIVNGSELQPYWRDMLNTLLRTSLQAQAPLGTQINGHMIVTDGFGIDSDGKAWFHVDYGWGNASGRWWDLDTAAERIILIYPNVFPAALGSIVAGRVADRRAAPIAGAALVLSDGQTARVTTTDASGAYCFSGLPEASAEALRPEDLELRSYTLTVLAPNCEPVSQTLTTAPFIDDGLRVQKSDAYEEAVGKGFFFPHTCGNSVADFTLTPIRYVAPDGAGDGRSWRTAAPLSQATLDAFPGTEIRLAAGDYALSATLHLPQAVTLSGGWEAETGLCAPLTTPSRLIFSGADKDAYLKLEASACLEGVTIEGSAWANVMLCDTQGGAKPVVRRCRIRQARPNQIGANIRFEACLLEYSAPYTEECAFFHCSFTASAFEDKEGVDLGGNRYAATESDSRPTSPCPCQQAGAAGHNCPETGLDGAPLLGSQGALAPAAAGYSLQLN